MPLRTNEPSDQCPGSGRIAVTVPAVSPGVLLLLECTVSANLEVHLFLMDIIHIAELKLNDQDSFFSFWVFLYEVCIRQIKDQIYRKWSTVGTHRNADRLLTNRSTKHNKYVAIKNSSILIMSVSGNFFVESEFFVSVFFTEIIYPS